MVSAPPHCPVGLLFLWMMTHQQLLQQVHGNLGSIQYQLLIIEVIM
jgi:hypothetical protein